MNSSYFYFYPKDRAPSSAGQPAIDYFPPQNTEISSTNQNTYAFPIMRRVHPLYKSTYPQPPTTYIKRGVAHDLVRYLGEWNMELNDIEESVKSKLQRYDKASPHLERDIALDSDIEPDDTSDQLPGTNSSLGSSLDGADLGCFDDDDIEKHNDEDLYHQAILGSYSTQSKSSVAETIYEAKSAVLEDCWRRLRIVQNHMKLFKNKFMCLGNLI
ncbi:hypothetical protein BDV18DRAFT_130723 [Aspergillus unguis]